MVDDHVGEPHVGRHFAIGLGAVMCRNRVRKPLWKPPPAEQQTSDARVIHPPSSALIARAFLRGCRSFSRTGIFGDGPAQHELPDVVQERGDEQIVALDNRQGS
jgi:hypothetical protein